MRYGEVKRLLQKNGCYKLHEGKRHEIWYSPTTGKQFEVGRHDGEEVKNGILHSILKASGIK